MNIIECSVCGGSGMIITDEKELMCANCAGQGVLGTDGQNEYMVRYDEANGTAAIVGIKPTTSGNSTNLPLYSKYVIPIFLIIISFGLGLVSLAMYLLGIKLLGQILGITAVIVFFIFFISIVMRIPWIIYMFQEPRDFEWVVNQKKSLKH